MFTVCDPVGNPFVEVRRNPFSQGYGGIHAAEETHLRLVNAACYYDDAVQRLQNFMDAYGYTFGRITRVDICMDFEKFDYGDEPAKFLERYLKKRYSKNQSRQHHRPWSRQMERSSVELLFHGAPYLCHRYQVLQQDDGVIRCRYWYLPKAPHSLCLVEMPHDR